MIVTRMSFNERENVCVCMCVHTYVCTIRGRVTEEETSSKKNALHSLFFFLPSKKQSTSPSASEREGRSIHFFIFCEQSTQFPGIFFPSLSFQARIRAGAVQCPLPSERQLHPFRMKVKRRESVPLPKTFAQVSL